MNSSGYVTVFDVAQAGYTAWPFVGTGLSLSAIGAALVFGPRLLTYFAPSLASPTKRPRSRIIFSWFFFLFASSWSLVAFGATYFTYLSLLTAERQGQFQIVEGVVDNFHPMPYGGHEDESFEVKGIKFAYSDYSVTAGFNNTAAHGGPIRAGAHVRIAFIGNKIIRLEIRSDDLPKKSELDTFAKKQEVSKNDRSAPISDQVAFGLAIAIFYVVVRMNLEPSIFLRFWLSSGPPYGRLATWTFRTLLLVSLVTATWQLAEAISAKQRSLADYKDSALYSLLWIGGFTIAELFLRARLKREQASAKPSAAAADPRA